MNTPEYNKAYWKKHKRKLLAAKKKRYATDSDYRKAVKKRAAVNIALIRLSKRKRLGEKGNGKEKGSVRSTR